MRKDVTPNLHWFSAFTTHFCKEWEPNGERILDVLNISMDIASYSILSKSISISDHDILCNNVLPLNRCDES